MAAVRDNQGVCRGHGSVIAQDWDMVGEIARCFEGDEGVQSGHRFGGDEGVQSAHRFGGLRCCLAGSVGDDNNEEDGEDGDREEDFVLHRGSSSSSCSTTASSSPLSSSNKHVAHHRSWADSDDDDDDYDMLRVDWADEFFEEGPSPALPEATQWVQRSGREGAAPPYLDHSGSGGGVFVCLDRQTVLMMQVLISLFVGAVLLSTLRFCSLLSPSPSGIAAQPAEGGAAAMGASTSSIGYAPSAMLHDLRCGLHFVLGVGLCFAWQSNCTFEIDADRSLGGVPRHAEKRGFSLWLLSW
mmetsp:Transcript_87357/g.250348  ORF Transcript_87357/g.250348 Transcript_87357/m.250348 type:complete len:298 (-) Transcript_87357:71-964(-)